MNKESNTHTVNDSKDCLECRLISGFGAIGIGTYLYYHGRNRTKYERHAMTLLATGAAVFGVARLFNLSLSKAKTTNP